METGNISSSSSGSISPPASGKPSTSRASHREVRSEPDVKETLSTAQELHHHVTASEKDYASESPVSSSSSYSRSSAFNKEIRIEKQKRQDRSKLFQQIKSQCQQAFPKATISEIPELLKTQFAENIALRKTLFPNISPDEKLSEKLDSEVKKTFDEIKNIGQKSLAEKNKITIQCKEINKKSESLTQSLMSLLKRYETLPQEQPTSPTGQHDLVPSPCSELRELVEQFTTFTETLSQKSESMEWMDIETERVKLESKLLLLQTLSRHLSSASTSERKRPAETFVHEEPTTSKKVKLEGSEHSS